MCYQTRQIRTVKDLELRFNVGLVNEDYRPIFDRPAFHLNGFAHPNMLVIPQDKPEVLAQRFVEQLEEKVKANPEQWFNYHPFYKD